MPRFVLDDLATTDKPMATSGGVTAMTRGPGPLTLKRGRQTMEPRVSCPPCMLKCCAERKDFFGSGDPFLFANEASIFCTSSRAVSTATTTTQEPIQDQGDFPEDDFEDFDLGPPPPCGPVLMRQNAMDATAAAEAKFVTMAKKLEPKTTPVTVVMMPSRGGASTVMMGAPMFLHRSRSSKMN